MILVRATLLVVLALCVCISARAQICLGSNSFTIDPAPVGDQYTPGTTVELCFAVTGYNQTAVNWLHGVIPEFGPGWDLSTLSTTAPSACSPPGSWLWDTHPTLGDGFFFDTDSGSPNFAVDGNPFNNYGDADVGDNCSATFCWTITTITSGSGIVDLSVSVNTTGDWETGSWTSSGCQSDPVPVFSSSLIFCDPAPDMAGLVGDTQFCAGAPGTSSVSYTATADPLFSSYQWTLPPGGSIVSENDNTVVVDLSAVTGGQICASGVNDCAPGVPACLNLVFATSSPVTLDVVPDLCEGETLDLPALVLLADGVTTWYDADPSVTSANIVDIVNPVASTSYWLEFTDAVNGCTSLTEVPVTVGGSAVFSLLPLPIVCPGGMLDLASLNGPEPGTFEWFDNLPSIGLPAVTATADGGTYWVLYTDPVSGCADSLDVQITGSASVDFDVPIGEGICFSSSIIFSDYNGISPGTYDWYADLPFLGNLVSEATLVSDTSFWLIYTDPLTFCYDSVAVDFTILPNPPFSVEQPPVICDGQSFDLSVLNGFDAGIYQWFDGLPSQGLAGDVVFPIMGNEYWVVFTDAVTNCSDSTFVSFTTGAGADFSIADIPPLCAGQTITLSDYNGFDPGFYSWFDGLPTGGNLIEELTLSPGQEIWVLFFEEATTCLDSLQVNFELSVAPAFSVTEIPPACAGSEITFADFNGPEDGTFTWFDGLPSEGNSLESAAPTEESSYWVLFNAQGGPCSDSLEVNIALQAAPAFSILDQPAACEGSAFDLSVMNGPEDGTYQWYDGFPSTTAANSEIVADNNDLYWVLFTDAATGCTDSLQIVFAASDNPAVEVGEPQAICAGDLFDLAMLNGALEGSYEWFEGLPSEAVSVSEVTPETSTEYWVLYSNDAGCIDSLSVNLTVLPIPEALFDADPSICADGTSQITVEFSGALNDPDTANFVWDFGGGDADPGTGPGPHLVSFADAGEATISLIVNEAGCESEAFEGMVAAINPVAIPDISCSSTPSSVSFEWTAVESVESYDLSVSIDGAGTAPITGTTDLSYDATDLSQGQVVSIIVSTNPEGDNPCGSTESTLECAADDCPSIDILFDVPTEVCESEAAFSIAASSPEGVQVSVNGEEEDQFDPAVLGPGPYQISYDYVADDGCVYSDVTEVTVQALPSADFDIDSNDICSDGTLTVTYSGAAGTSATYDWDFGGGSETALGGESYEVSFDGATSTEMSLTVTQDGCQSEPVSIPVTVSEPLEPPTINCSSTTTSVTFDWSNVPGAEDYIVYVGIGGATPTDAMVDGGLLSYTVEDLPADETTAVVLEVQAFGPLPCGASDFVSAECSTSDCPPNPIVNGLPEVICVEEGSVDFLAQGMISPTGSSLSGDGITADVIDLAVAAGLGNPVSITISYLDPDTGCEYELNHSLQIDPVLEPIELTCVETTDSSATLEWNAVPAANGYLLEYNGNVTTVAGNSFTAEALDPGVTTSFTLSTETASTCGPTSASIECSTSACPTVSTPIVELLNLCEGETVDFASYEMAVDYIDEGGSFDGFAWFEDAALTTVVASPAYAGDGCAVQTQTLYLGLLCSLEGNAPLAAGSLELTFYPNFALSQIDTAPGDCALPELSSSCPAYLITEVNVPAAVEPGSSGEAVYEISYENAAGVDCFLEEVTVPYSCPPLGCPTVDQAADDVLSLCPGETPDLAAIEALVQISDPQLTSAGLSWFADAAFTQPLDLSTLAYTGDGCATSVTTIYLGLACTVDPTIVYGGSLVLTFYPDYDVSLVQFTPEDCAVPLPASTCASYQIMMIDIPIDIYPGESGEALFEISYDDGAGFSCFTEDFPVPYSCPQQGCPTVDAPVDDIASLCVGETPDLSSVESAVVINDPELTSAGLTWYSDAAFTQLLDPTSLGYLGDGCAVSQTTIYLGLACTVDVTIVYAGSLNLSFYPEYDPALLQSTPGECAAPQLSSTCANYLLTEIDVPTEVLAGESGEASYQISYEDGTGQSCFLEDIMVPYSCPALGCPTVDNAVESSVSLCIGESPDLAAIEASVNINDPEVTSAGLSWYTDAALSEVLDPSNLVYTGDGCASSSTTIYLGLACTVDVVISYAGSLQISFYPDFDSSFVSSVIGDCAAPTIETSCPFYLISEQDVPAEVGPGISGLATWTISYDSDITCWEEQYTESYACAPQLCPETLSPLAAVEAVCDGSLLDLASYASSVELENASTAGDFVWYSDAELTVAFTGDQVPYAGDGCAQYTQDLYLAVPCTVDQSLVPLGSLTVSVYPPVLASSEYIESVEGDCTAPTVSVSCADFALTALDVPDTVEAGESGVGTWSVSYAGAADCGAATIEVAYFCAQAGCPEITNPADQSYQLCSAEFPDLQAVLDAVEVQDPEGTAGDFVWYSDAGLSVPADLSSYDYAGDNCTTDIYNLFLGLDCDVDENPVFAGSVELVFYPDFDQSLLVSQAGNCSAPTLQSNCPQYLITAIDVPTEVPSGESGVASWQLTYSGDFSCFDEIQEESYACPAGCPTVDLPLDEQLSICQGQTIDFAFYESQVVINDPDNNQDGLNWYADAQLTELLDQDNIAYSGDGCLSQMQVVYLGLACTIDEQVIAAGSLQVNIYPAVDLSLLQTTEGDCAPPQINSSCDNYIVEEVSVPSTVEAGEAGVGTWTVTSPLPNGIENCQTTTVEVSYSCPLEGCPQITSPVLLSEALCVGDQIDLLTAAADLEYSDPDGNIGDINWYTSASLDQQLDPGTLIYSGDGCTPEVVEVFLGVECNIDPNIIFAGSYTITFYPDYDSVFLESVPGSCLPPMLNSNCDFYQVTEVDIPTEVLPGESGTASYSIAYSDGLDIVDLCFDPQLIEVPYSCASNACPTVVTPLAEILSLCPDEDIDLESTLDLLMVDDPDGNLAGRAWYADPGFSTPASAPQYTGDGCEPQEFQYFAGIECAIQSGVIPAGTMSITVYPEYDASNILLSDTECEEPAVELLCPNYDAMLNGIAIGPISEGQSGEVSWLITYNGASCWSEEAMAIFDCPAAPCLPPDDPIGEDQSYCAGEPVPLLTIVDNFVDNFVWYEDPSAAIELAQGSSFMPPGPGTYYVQAVSPDDCLSEGFTAIVLEELAQASASFGYPSQVYCTDEASVSVTGAQPGGTFTSDGLIVDAATGAFDPGLQAPGSYTVTYTIDGQCPDVSTFALDIIQQPSAVLSYPELICLGDEWQVELSATAGPEAVYTWTFGSTANSSASIDNSANVEWTEAGTFDFQLSIEDQGCIYETIGTVIVDQLELTASGSATIFPGESADLVADAFSDYGTQINYNWIEEESLDCLDCPLVTASPLEDTNYTVIATNENNCTAQESLSVLVDGEIWLVLPTAFSPNGDGSNDTWRLITKNASEAEFLIFDRWGQLLYTGRSLDDAWDGTHAGEQVALGVYVYYCKIEFLDGETREYKGNITLIR